MAQTKAQKEAAAAKKRSDASKKAAATRKANEAKVTTQPTPPTASSDPNPDQDVPNAFEQKVPQEDRRPALEPYSPRHPQLQNAGFDQVAAEDQRQAELAAEREEHNERTGDVSRMRW